MIWLIAGIAAVLFDVLMLLVMIGNAVRERRAARFSKNEKGDVQ